MSARRSPALALLFSFLLPPLLALASCESPQRRAKPGDQTYGGIDFRVHEESKHRSYGVPTDRRTDVDSRSELVLTFGHEDSRAAWGTSTSADASPNGKDWENVNALLRRTQALEVAREQMNEVVVDSADEAARARLQEDAYQLALRVGELLDDLSDFGLTQEQIDQILTPEENGDGPYVRLARWLRAELARLESEGKAWVKSRPQTTVTVGAYLFPVVGESRALHIDGWDTIASETLESTPGSMLSLTAAERARLDFEMGQARAAKAIIDDLKSKDSKLVDVLRQAREELQTWFQRLGESLGNASSSLDALLTELDALAASDANVAGPVGTLAAKLREIRALVARVQTFVVGADDLISRLRAMSLAELLRSAVLKDQTYVDLLAAAQEASLLVEEVKGVGPTLAGIKGALADLPDAVAKDLRQRVKVWTASTVDGLQSTLPAGKPLFDTLTQLLGGAVVSQGTRELADARTDLIRRPSDRLAEARLSLESMTEGDKLNLVVRFYDDDDEQYEYEESYKLNAHAMGLYRDVSGVLIFARGDQGGSPATDWQPNVAAMMNWHYRYRQPKNRFHTFWNEWNPGLGVHVATLDQGDDSVEVGTGFNVSLWSEYLYAGLGWNLNVDDDRLYYFFGTNLFRVLTAARDALSPSGS